MLKGELIMQARSCCINQVLGTDMKKHFDITSRFQVSPHRCCSGESREVSQTMSLNHSNLPAI